MQSLPAGERPIFSMQDFFAENECEWFLDQFTETAFPIEHRMVTPAGMQKAFDWPRKLSRKVRAILTRLYNLTFCINHVLMTKL